VECRDSACKGAVVSHRRFLFDSRTLREGANAGNRISVDKTIILNTADAMYGTTMGLNEANPSDFGTTDSREVVDSINDQHQGAYLQHSITNHWICRGAARVPHYDLSHTSICLSY